MAYSNSKGFTVVELMIAISVFSVAMILVMTGVIFISKKYQQSSTRVALEDASRNIHQQVIQAAQFTQRSSSSAVSRDAPSGNLTARCIGKDMYIFDKNALSISSSNTAAFNTLDPGLWIKRDATGGCEPTLINKTDATNLLPPGAVVINFNYSSNTLSTVFIKAPNNTFLKFGAANTDTTCDIGLAGREFCADVRLTSYSVGRID